MNSPIFSDDHHDMFYVLKRWVEEEVYPNREEWEETTYPSSMIKRAGDLGFLGLTYPDKWGGQGGDYYYSLVRAEALSYSWSGGFNMGFLVHTDMATPPIEVLGTDFQKEMYLAPSISGDKISCLGITEPSAGSDVLGIKTRAVKKGDDWVLNGSKVFITNGLRAHFCLVVARTEDVDGHGALSLFLVDLRDDDLKLRPGIKTQKIEKMGMHASDTAEIFFEDVLVPESNLLGERGQGFYHISWELQGERLVGAIGCVASAERLLERTIGYAKNRKAFGKNISSFQSIRHKLARMQTEIDAARQLTYSAAWQFANDKYPVREISEAKLFASEVLCRVADECLQIHGGWGYTKEYEIERIYRDSRLNRIGAGTDEIMLEVIGRLL